MSESDLTEFVTLALNGGVLGFLSFQDIKKKSVSLIPVLVLVLINLGLCVYMHRSPVAVLTGILPGVFALAVSFGSKGKMGIGDGLVLTSMGLVADWDRVMAIWLVALVLSAVTGIVLMLVKRATIKTALPFLPFLLAGGAILEVAERVSV